MSYGISYLNKMINTIKYLKEIKHMENKKTRSPIIRFIANILNSRVARNVAIFVILALATLGMFMLDEANATRQNHFKFLESNVVLTFMEMFGIERINLLRGSWLLFIFASLFIVFLLIGNSIEHKILEHRKNGVLVKIIYYLLVIVAFAGFTYVAYILGAFDRINESAGLFLNLLYTVLLALLFIALVPIFAILLYYVVKVLTYCGVIAFTHLRKFGKKVHSDHKRVLVENGDATEEDYELTSAERVFPALVKIDKKGQEQATVNTEITLNELALQFQSYAANVHKIYYGLPLIRSFFAGLGTSRLIILEGLSGTGKSMLPRMFSEFTGSKAFFAPVQATWRDKTDVLGFYSEFAKTFKTTQFLENLYSASYTDKANLMVLDEMNLSRIEYYFADFLSVMEYPPEDWKIRVHEIQAGQTLPEKLENGLVTVPENTWFIGTANTDDSTFTITDKVYDRAVVIDFEEKNHPIKTNYKADPITISAEKLTELYSQAESNDNNRLSEQEIEKFLKVCDFMKESFNVRFGNRIMVQIESFVPIYVALGGTKEEALDFMFARKILRKVDGMFEDFVKDELANLQKLITTLYGKNVFKETEKLIAKFTKRLV